MQLCRTENLEICEWTCAKLCQGLNRCFVLPHDVEDSGVNRRIVVSKAVNAAAFAGNARRMVGRNPRVKPLIPL